MKSSSFLDIKLLLDRHSEIELKFYFDALILIY